MMTAEGNFPVILYGAGRRALSALSEVREQQGLTPVCFCDIDARKWGTACGNLPVMSLSDALGKYPESRLYITVAPPLKYEVCRELGEKWHLSKDRVVNFDAGSQAVTASMKYRSCFWLENYMGFDGYNLMLCCNHGESKNKPFYIPMGDSNRETFARFAETRDQTIKDNLTRNKSTPCTSCRWLVEGEWATEKKVRHLSFGVQASCNLSCIYCQAMNRRNSTDRFWVNENLLHFDFSGFLDDLETTNLLDPNGIIDVGSGEITIHPNGAAFLSRLHGYRVVIASNALVYNRGISRLAQQEGSSLIVSLDSGNREGFLRVKRVDAFDRVVDNIRRYRSEAGNVILKYIVVSENNDAENLTGFYKVCCDCDIGVVIISVDTLAEYDAKPAEIINAIVELACGLKMRGVEVRLATEFLSLRQINEINVGIEERMKV